MGETDIEAITEAIDQGDHQEVVDSDARRLACEECLHTIATYALELEAGKRESIAVEDIVVAFKAHDLTEIYEEAKIFFDDSPQDSDLQDAGEEGDEEEDEDDSDEPEDE